MPASDAYEDDFEDQDETFEGGEADKDERNDDGVKGFSLICILMIALMSSGLIVGFLMSGKHLQIGP